MPDHRDDRRDQRHRVEENPQVHGRIGVRVVPCAKRQGRRQVQQLDPAAYRCWRLASQLADEWVEYVAATEITNAASATYRQAIEKFCATVDTELASNTVTSIDLSSPRLAPILARWERTLPSSYPAGSMRPAGLASRLRGLIIRRDDHPDRDVAPELVQIARGPMLVPWGQSAERDEFSRKDKLALVRTAWTAANELERRLSVGWRLAEQGQHPEQGSWLNIPDLLWGLSRRMINLKDINEHLPPFASWPAELRGLVEYPDRVVVPRLAKRQLLRWLVRQLYPSNLDLHAFRVLLMDATGMTSEEVDSLREQDIEFLPNGVRLTVVKKRAGRVRHRAFRDSAPRPGGEGPISRTVTDRPRRQASAIVARLLEVTEKVREQLPEIDDLFVQAVVTPRNELNFGRWNPESPASRFSTWMTANSLTVSGDPHIGRLRKATKVEKAIVARGRVSIAADDHLEQTFAGHYAQGTTLRIISGEVITTAQGHWFGKAIDGPTVITADAGEATADPAWLRTQGLDAEQADGIVRGQLDMGLSHCKNPYESPFSPAGELCPVAPLRCLECRNAWVLPSHLPQLLLFSEYLDNLKRRLPPARFTALWGKSYANLRAALADRSGEELSLARKHIEAGQASLHLPLTAHAEFDQ